LVPVRERYSMLTGYNARLLGPLIIIGKDRAIQY
jgi:hypothetical protein